MKNERKKIVILPGLDGTGRLLVDFAEQLERHFFQVEVISYPTQEPYTYDALLDIVRSQLPNEDFILIGESFSGPLAIRIASENPPFLKAVVLGASFARVDFPLKRVIAGVLQWVPFALIPFVFLNALLMGGRATPNQRHELKGALGILHPDVARMRVKEVLTVDLTNSGLTVSQPLLYLNASADLLIGAQATEALATIVEDMSIKDIPAPHFLFQMEPALCAQAVMEFSRPRFDKS
ncbi:lysophospholipase [Mesorhizobium sp. M0016]|uniref:alpha/beta fold hydrolase n=1 Tax=Mesorhizobium sp. M0016 TaxID=2956843 RepID=UPI00333B3BD4